MAHQDKNNPYGYDLYLRLDMTQNAKTAWGKEVVINALIGRLVDELWYAPDYGVQLPQRLLRQDPRTYHALASETERELEQDDRVENIRVQITQPDGQGKVTVYINGRLVDSDEDFSLIGNLSTFDASEFSFAAQ